MIERFDHAVIGVQDLAAAVENYCRLGFEVSPGGRHTGRGTANAIIRFGLDYIELLSIVAPEELSGSSDSLAMTEYLRDRSGGYLGYAVAASDLDGDARRFAATGLRAEPPFAMERMRPDGHLLSWRLLVPEGRCWHQAWPFLIDWDQTDQQRLAWESPGKHPNGASRVASARVMVQDLEAGIHLYADQLGLGEPVRTPGGVRFKAGPCSIDVVASPVGPHGITEVVLTVPDFDRTSRVLSGKIRDVTRAGGPRRAELVEELTLGASIILEEGS